MTSDPILDFWNARAGLMMQAGSNDVLAKSLEIEALAPHIANCTRVAEFGCGNGVTAIEFAKRFGVEIHAFDFSPDMVAEARKNAQEAGVGDRVRFAVADIRNPPKLSDRFDVVYCERMVINLPDWTAQAEAIRSMALYLRPEGRLVICENSANGLAALNELRGRVGLDPIKAPWHNVYLDDDAAKHLEVPGCRLLDVDPFSATYYFLSRVVNAWLAKQEGRQPSYDAPVNHLAALLPPFGECAQGKLWIWIRDKAPG